MGEWEKKNWRTNDVRITNSHQIRRIHWPSNSEAKVPRCESPLIRNFDVFYVTFHWSSFIPCYSLFKDCSFINFLFFSLAFCIFLSARLLSSLRRIEVWNIAYTLGTRGCSNDFIMAQRVCLGDRSSVKVFLPTFFAQSPPHFFPFCSRLPPLALILFRIFFSLIFLSSVFFFFPDTFT